jgi:hypothetical protein
MLSCPVVAPSAALEPDIPSKAANFWHFIVVHDHIIVGKQGHPSFRGLGLI